jgi:orotidine-5'-phosphate decarboxylase
MAPEPLLSTRAIPPHERLIVALDLPGAQEALALCERLGDSVAFYKVGLELFLAGSCFDLLERLRDAGKQVFVDLKLFDVPETVARAVRQLARRPARFATVHGNESILRAACREKGDLALLAVTVLTSLDQDDFADLGVDVAVEDLVLSRARRALAVGCDGVVCSGVEAAALRRTLGQRLLIVAPGIRALQDPRGDQKRAVDVAQAFRNGADYIVMGRPIRDAEDPRRRALEVQEQIAGVFA